MKIFKILMLISILTLIQWSCKEEVYRACSCDIEYSAPVQSCTCLVFDDIPDTLLSGGITYLQNLNLKHQHYYNGEIWQSCGYLKFAERQKKLNFKWTVENCEENVTQRILVDSVPNALGKYTLCNECLEEQYAASYKFIIEGGADVIYVPDDSKDNYIEILNWDTIYWSQFPWDSSYVAAAQGKYQMHWIPEGEQLDSFPREVIIAKGNFYSELIGNSFE